MYLWVYARTCRCLCVYFECVYVCLCMFVYLVCIVSLYVCVCMCVELIWVYLCISVYLCVHLCICVCVFVYTRKQVFLSNYGMCSLFQNTNSCFPWFRICKYSFSLTNLLVPHLVCQSTLSLGGSWYTKVFSADFLSYLLSVKHLNVVTEL